MKTTTDIRRWFFANMLILSTVTVFAQPIRHGYRHYHSLHRPVVTTIVTRPATTTRITNRLSKQDRLDMALAYLRTKKDVLTVKKYSQITGLSTSIAEAELDVFSINKNIPIKQTKSGNKKVYVLS